MKISLPAALCAFLLAFGAPAAANSASDMLAAVNAARAAEGQAALTLDERLSAAACRQARDLARRALHRMEDLSHQGSDGSRLGDRLRDAGYAFRAAAENLAAGVADPAETVRLWLASEDHRRNILTASFREAGIAHAGPTLSPGGDRVGPMEVWVLVLATPQAAGAPPTSANNPNDCRS